LAPTFNRNKELFIYYLKSIIELKKDKNNNIKFFAELRTENLNENEIKLLKEAGFEEIEIGVQSINKETLRSIKRGLTNFSQSNIFKTIKTIKEYGIKPIIDFIIGLPGETEKMIKDTIEILDQQELLEFSNFYHLLILPGTDLKSLFIEKKFKFQNFPPYLALKTDKMNIENIKNIYLYLETKKEISYYDEFFIGDREHLYITRTQSDLNFKKENGLYNTNLLISANFLYFDNMDENTILKFNFNNLLKNFKKNR